MSKSMTKMGWRWKSYLRHQAGVQFGDVAGRPARDHAQDARATATQMKQVDQQNAESKSPSRNRLIVECEKPGNTLMVRYLRQTSPDGDRRHGGTDLASVRGPSIDGLRPGGFILPRLSGASAGLSQSAKVTPRTRGRRKETDATDISSFFRKNLMAHEAALTRTEKMMNSRQILIAIFMLVAVTAITAKAQSQDRDNPTRLATARSKAAASAEGRVFWASMLVPAK
jgi:hypothetical protein